MFLQLLTEQEEKFFFLEFAYLLAVAEENVPQESIPKHTHMYSDNLEDGEFAFMKFAPGFPMETAKLLTLRKFSQEFGWTRWDVVFSSSGGRWDSSNSFSFGNKKQLSNEQQISSYFHMPAKIEKSLELNEEADRATVLKTVLKALFLKADASSFSIEKRKTILMESVPFGYTKGIFSHHANELLNEFCSYCNLDNELIDDCKSITEGYANLHKKAFEIITE